MPIRQRLFQKPLFVSRFYRVEFPEPSSVVCSFPASIFFHTCRFHPTSNAKYVNLYQKQARPAGLSPRSLRCSPSRSTGECAPERVKCLRWNPCFLKPLTPTSSGVAFCMPSMYRQHQSLETSRPTAPYRVGNVDTTSTHSAL